MTIDTEVIDIVSIGQNEICCYVKKIHIFLNSYPGVPNLIVSTAKKPDVYPIQSITANNVILYR